MTRGTQEYPVVATSDSHLLNLAEMNSGNGHEGEHHANGRSEYGKDGSAA
jgi:hypothetical protein